MNSIQDYLEGYYDRNINLIRPQPDSHMSTKTQHSLPGSNRTQGTPPWRYFKTIFNFTIYPQNFTQTKLQSSTNSLGALKIFQVQTIVLATKESPLLYLKNSMKGFFSLTYQIASLFWLKKCQSIYPTINMCRFQHTPPFQSDYGLSTSRCLKQQPFQT